jgi:hypothetical protein
MNPMQGDRALQLGKARPVPDGVVPLVTDEEVGDAELLDAVIGHFGAALAASHERDALVGSLGIDLAMAQRLRIGLSDRTLGLRLPDRRWKAGNVLRARLTELGILRDSGHEAFRGCVVVPLTDGSGNVVGLFGRRTDGSGAEVWARGLPGGIFVPQGGDRSDAQCLVVGSVLDALAVLNATEHFVVAPARPKGFAKSDLAALATRAEALLALGRGGAEFADPLLGVGASVAVAAPDVEVAVALGASRDPSGALAALVDSARVLESPRSSSAEPATVGARVVRVDRSDEVDELHVHAGSRTWRVRGAAGRSNLDGDALHVALSVADTASGRFHLDTLDLYSARQRNGFVAAAVAELHAERPVIVSELGEVIAAAERACDEAASVGARRPEVTMSEAERAEALEWLRAPRLLDRLAADLGSLGVVGEQTNLLVCYLATVSRLCERPFGVLVQSSSAAGKSTLADAVCALVPKEDLVSLSAVTSQALYYLGRADLSRKVLALAEEHGATRAAYALKLLVSEGRLSIASTGKDRASGKLSTTSYEIAGPVALVMTTTAPEIDPELENRLVTVGVDEDAAQTRAIVEAQRHAATLDGLVARAARERLRTLHANVQRLLEPLPVVIADLDVAFPAHATRHRRDHAKLVSIVSAIALLHQHQREHKSIEVDGTSVTYLEASAEDVAAGLSLARAVLVQGGEHLAPNCARLLRAFRDVATERAKAFGCTPGEVGLTRRELRETLGWTDKAVRTGTDRLVALEYLVVSGGGRGRCRTYRYVGEVAPVGPLRGPVRPGHGPSENGTPAGSMPEFAQFAHIGDAQLEGQELIAAYPKDAEVTS